MKTIIKYICLPFTFSQDKMLQELNALNEQWIMHFNKAHYDGEWSALPLRSVGGSITHVRPENNGGEFFADTVLMDKCPYLKSILANFPCDHRAVRLLKLKAGAIIKEHTDAELSYEHGEARIHVPIMTNPQVEFYLDNERVDMLPGSCWYMNFNLPHRINNFGDTDRVHFVMDIIVNDRIRELFEQVVPEKKKIIAEKEKFSKDQKLTMIEMLKGMNTEVGNRLAKEMEAEISLHDT
ncbi:MAG: aspartyl/asparaginyl beta-hydroxylase protein [Flavipsychrobacter sp.]|jgi:quercetin dioxygenase-like cupin family protein|nr:aspartyl/asparaginyl beta-hydroxylase protein [Flavipsychrobacter sp.]